MSNQPLAISLIGYGHLGKILYQVLASPSTTQNCPAPAEVTDNHPTPPSTAAAGNTGGVGCVSSSAGGGCTGYGGGGGGGDNDDDGSNSINCSDSNSSGSSNDSGGSDGGGGSSDSSGDNAGSTGYGGGTDDGSSSNSGDGGGNKVKIFRRGDNLSAAIGSDLIVIAVRPADVPAVLQQLTGFAGQLWTVAIAPQLSVYEAALPQAQIFRIMPNVAIAEGLGVTGYYTQAPDDSLVLSIFRGTGLIIRVTSEAQLESIAALAGSSIAYFLRFAQALEKVASQKLISNDTDVLMGENVDKDCVGDSDGNGTCGGGAGGSSNSSSTSGGSGYGASCGDSSSADKCSRTVVAEDEGFKVNESEQLVKQILLATAQSLKDPTADLQTLINQIATPGGTTEAALQQMERDKVDLLVENTVEANLRKIRELNSQ